MNWTKITGAAGYGIIGKQLGAAGWTTLTVGGENTLFKDVFGLLNNTSYVWAVRGICDTGFTQVSGFGELDTFVTASANRLAYNTSSSKQADAGQFLIYPNPAKDILNIRINSFGGQYAHLKLYDTSGKVLLFKKPTSPDFELNISNLPSGIYQLLKFRTGKIA